jgi:hypothetical protein
MRQEHTRVGAPLAHAPSKLLVHQDVHGAGAVRARRRNFHLQAVVSEAPFDEGRSKRILRSSAEDPLAGAEPQPVRRPVSGHGKGPTHLAVRVPDQEKQAPLQVIEQLCD